MGIKTYWHCGHICLACPWSAQVPLSSLQIPTSRVFLGVPGIFTLFCSTAATFHLHLCLPRPCSCLFQEGCFDLGAVPQCFPSSKALGVQQPCIFFTPPHRAGASSCPCANENAPFSMGIKPGLTRQRTRLHVLLFQFELWLLELKASCRIFPPDSDHSYK